MTQAQPPWLWTPNEQLQNVLQGKKVGKSRSFPYPVSVDTRATTLQLRTQAPVHQQTTNHFLKEFWRAAARRGTAPYSICTDATCDW